MMQTILSLDRYIDENNTGWIKCTVKLNKTYTFITNGRKLYRNRHDVCNKMKTLKRADCVDFDKCDIENIIKKLTKYHPNTIELDILKSINLNWMLICIYTPYDKQIIRHFFTKEQPNVVYGNGATHIGDDYVLYSTTRLGVNNTETYENLTNDQTRLYSFLQKQIH